MRELEHFVLMFVNMLESWGYGPYFTLADLEA